MKTSIEPNDEFDQLTAVRPIGGGKFWECKCKCDAFSRDFLLTTSYFLSPD